MRMHRGGFFQVEAAEADAALALLPRRLATTTEVFVVETMTV